MPYESEEKYFSPYFSVAFLLRILHLLIVRLFCCVLTSGILPQPNDNAYYASSRAVMVNINEADIADLTLLDGIGYARAEDIIRYRQVHGNFRQPEDIMDVPGIGEGIYRRIRNQIQV